MAPAHDASAVPGQESPTATAGPPDAGVARSRRRAARALARWTVRFRVPRRIRRLLEPAARLGADPRDSPEERLRKALLVTITLMVLPAAALWGALYWAFGERTAALIPWQFGLVAIGCLAIFGRTHSFRFLRDTQLLLILIEPFALMLLLGGLVPSSGVILWSFLAPLGAITFDRPERAWPWFAAFLALLLVSVPLAPLVRTSETALPDDMVLAFTGLNIGAVALISFTLLAIFARERELARRRVEDLLLNILPEDVARRLEVDRHAIADRYDSVTVLFADVVDFTPLSARLSPVETVTLLDELFSQFDDLVDRYELEKIKTIGDAYMVVAGVPRERPDHAAAVASLALDMQECARRFRRADGGGSLELRIGINSGPVVAGVIGRRRFLYDLWGDTVNMASRMESHGTPQKIQMTRATRELVRGSFVCQRRGIVSVKGKGEVETWYLVGRRDDGATVAPPAESAAT